ncbi:MAG: glycosyltransferase [Candidatus Bathyarchaeum tardum]|nr:MAG: glycosyltransferase [Candidatus Bathyarchaeum tardum]
MIFVGIPTAYHQYMKHQAAKPWLLNIDTNYRPSVSIIVPMSNEEKTVKLKLKNLFNVNYPVEKVQIIIVNDGSTDSTLDKVHDFVNSNHRFDTRIFSNDQRIGKCNSMNHVLKHTTGEIIVVSDADCFLDSEILVNALPYLSDPNVAAIAGKERLLNFKHTWITRGELVYNDFVQTLRVGESKTGSTIFFQGGFSAYKKSCLEEFNNETDDSGTALDLVQKGKRAILLSDAVFYTTFPTQWKSKVDIKIRRANQLQKIWMKCLKLFFQRKLKLPRSVFVPEIYLHLFAPLVFVMFILVSCILVINIPLLLPFFVFFLLAVVVAPKTRFLLVEMLQNNLILLVSMLLLFSKGKFKIWKTSDDSRSLLTEEMLHKKNLI